MTTDVSRGVEGLLRTHGKPAREVYLDSENSGLIFPEALEAMVEAYRKTAVGHPSITHRAGWEAYETLYKATATIARSINCSTEELVYTHSGTEANNLAILGTAKTAKGSKARKILVSSIEHLSVIFPAEQLQKLGFKVLKIPVDKEGFVNLDFISKNVDVETLLVSVAPVNHEIGVVQDIEAIVDIVKDQNSNVLMHIDACDSLGKMRLNLKRLNVDLASFSGHKVFGPKGVGALYVREGIDIEPIIYGQLSTQRLWPGIEDVPAIAGFAKAVETMYRDFESNVSHMVNLRDLLIDGILENVNHALLNGPKGAKRSPDNVNISFLYCEGEALTVELSLKGIYVSSGSACTSRILEPSHVLLAIGRRHEEAHGSLLMKVTPFHSEGDIEYVLENLPATVDRIRSMSPLKPGGG